MGIIYMASINDAAYIGKTEGTLKDRIYDHFYVALGRNSKTHFHNGLRKYGASAVEWIVLEELPNEELVNAEIFWIAYFRSIGAKLYNHTDGGEGFKGKHSEESKRKMSESHKGQIAWNKGLSSKTPKVKTIHGNAGVYDINIVSPSGDIYGPINNLSEFAKEHNLSVGHIHSVITGKRKSHKNWRLA